MADPVPARHEHPSRCGRGRRRTSCRGRPGCICTYSSPVGSSSGIERVHDSLVHRCRRRASRAPRTRPACPAARPPARRTPQCHPRRRDQRRRPAAQMSSEKRARLAITLMVPGSTSISPTVPTVTGPAARASRSSSTIASARGTSGRGKGPWASRRRGRRAMDNDIRMDIASDRVDDADALPMSSSTRACSMCISIQPVRSSSAWLHRASSTGRSPRTRRAPRSCVRRRASGTSRAAPPRSRTTR